MINLLAVLFTACGEDEKEDTAPVSELVSEEEAEEEETTK